ncbi:hypothetical protein Tco_0880406 [Tanacetum coccineum]
MGWRGTLGKESMGLVRTHVDQTRGASHGGNVRCVMFNMDRLLVFMYGEFHACQKRGLAPAIPADDLLVKFL